MLIYICSASRCGSTLTDMLLGSHPEVASLGEANFLGKTIKLGADCTCGAKVIDCPKWALVFARLRDRTGIDIRTDPYRFRLWNARAVNPVDFEYQTRARSFAMSIHSTWMAARETLPPLLRRYCPLPPLTNVSLENKMLLVGAISQEWQKHVVVDSSKNAREAMELYRRWPGHVKLVLLTRDGRGVFLSRRKAGRDRPASLRGWRNYYRRAVPLLERNISAGDLYRLRYEDLASQPEIVLQRLCEFMGVTFFRDMLDLSLGERHMVSGNATRFAPHKRISLDERWRTQLTREDLAYFNRQGGAEMNHRLGYS